MGLPGDTYRIKDSESECEGYNCDCTNLATTRMQGETDSFGAEYMDYCPECLAKCQKSIKAFEEEEDNCAWCKKKASLSPIRDWEEGLNGPVYYVCSSCRSKQNREINEELKWLDEQLGDN